MSDNDTNTIWQLKLSSLPEHNFVVAVNVTEPPSQSSPCSLHVTVNV